MAHAVSASFTRSEHMSPPAVGLALLLHVAVALALWWVSPLHAIDEPEDAIEVTMEPPPVPTPEVQKPAPPPIPSSTPEIKLRGLPPPAPSAAKPQSPGISLGLPSEAMPAEKREQAPARTEPPQQALAPPPSIEKELPPVEAPPAPLTSRDFPKPAPKPPQAQPPRPAPPQSALQPSPLSRLPPRAPPSQARPSEPSAIFVNPADQRRLNTIAEAYLNRVAYKVSQYRFYSQGVDETGVVVVRFAIARDGRLVGVSIARSSGKPTLDKNTLEAFRAASPYPPLPAELQGDAITFVLPFQSKYTR